ncbi:peptidylprolyl isomerase [Paenibacillus sp. FSL P2-0121]
MAEFDYCDPWHTVFGRVISGMDPVDTLRRGDVMKKVEIISSLNITLM